MLLQKIENLDEILVRILAARGLCTARELSELLNRQGHRYSLQGIYKELRKLIEQGVAMKIGDEFGLSLTWITNLTDLARRMYVTHADSKYIERILPPPRRKVAFPFTDLVRLDRFWVHSILAACKASSVNVFYQWMPHPWFELSPDKVSLHVESAWRSLNVKTYAIVGGTSSVESSCLSRWSRDVYTVSQAPGPFAHLDRDYLVSIGPYVLRFRLDQRTSTRIEELFNSSKSLTDIPAKEIYRLFNAPIRSTFTIKHDEKEATAVRRKVADFFGVKTP